MKICANNIKTGHIILYNNRFLLVLKTTHTKPGKGRAYIQIESRDIKNKVKINHRFRSNENINFIKLEEQELYYLYDDTYSLVLTDRITHEQKNIDKTLFDNNQLRFLQDGMKIILKLYDGEPLLATLPTTVQMIVKESELVVKGQNLSCSYKPAILENKVRIMVPPFINTGDKIVVDMKELKYLERVKQKCQ